MTLASPPIIEGARLPPELLRQAHGGARELTARGAREGSRIAIDSADVLPWLLGADLIGAAALVIEPAWTARERDAVLADARPDVVVDGSPPPPTQVPIAPAGDRHTPFYLPTTSGSSGRPSVLIRSRDSWLRSFAALPLPGTGPVLIPGPLSSSLFLFGALHALHAGRPLVLLPRWRAAEAARAGHGAEVVHLVPAMLSTLLDALAADPALRAACALRTVVCGGAHLTDGVRARLAELLPGCALVEYYGAAEHSLIAVRRDGAGLRPVPGVDVEVREGRIWVRSALTVLGRLERGALRPADPGWSTVDDLGTLALDGTLVVHGRGGATVSSGGRIVAAEEVEAALRSVPGVADVLVTGSPHRTLGAIVTAVVEIDPAAPPTLRDLRAGARARLEPAKRPRRWLTTTALPRTASGKPARAVVTDQLRDGTFPARTLA
ncbi:class I adenylate-forming enzyme family protein [Pseudonocardia sp. GCM10023141]|uniref:class I adenylate-forming enzyme family protein n=1 Tax=Pseudonocardia sp. GCM10023141 TaxID=3252653 RepID=UPI003616B139